MSAAVAESTPPSMVQRVTLIMESFDGRTSRRSLEDVAMRTGLPRSTAHRILDQLVQIGWLRHDQSGYSLGWRARQLGGPAHDVAVLREVAAPVLHDLATRTGLVVHFAVLDGPFALYLDKVGALSSAVPSRVGGQMVAFRTAVGRAMMARYKPEEVDELMTHRVRGSAVSPADVTRVQQELLQVRARGGVAYVNGDQHGVNCVGVALPAEFEGIQAGLSLCDAGHDVNLEQHAPLLLDRSRRIAGRLSSLDV